MEIKRSIICYLDFLGFSEDLLLLTDEDLSQYVDGFVEMLSRLQEVIKPIKTDIFKDLGKAECKDPEFMILSDSIIISVEFEDDKIADIIHLLILIAGHLQAHLLDDDSNPLLALIENRKIPYPLVRGAICCGEHYCKKEKNIIMSKALIKAYRQERYLSNMPVISVSEEVLELLKQDSIIYDKMSNEDFIINEYRYVKLPFINYLKFNNAKSDSEEKGFAECHMHILQTNMKILRKRNTHNDHRDSEKVFGKLRWLTGLRPVKWNDFPSQLRARIAGHVS